MKISRKILIFLIVAANPVYADEYYIGMNYGVSNQLFEPSLENNSLSIPNITYTKDYRAVDDSSDFYSLTFGYKLTVDLFLEVGFAKAKNMSGGLHIIDDGVPASNRVAEEVIDTGVTYVALVGDWKTLNNKLAFSVKLGLSSWHYGFNQHVYDVDDSASAMPFPNPPVEPVKLPADMGLIPVGIESYQDSGNALIYGVGVSYLVDTNIEIKIEMDSLNFKPEFNNIKVEQNMEMVYLGVIVHF
jgi:hypothetical protein